YSIHLRLKRVVFNGGNVVLTSSGCQLPEPPAAQSAFDSGKPHLRRSVRVPFLDEDQQAGRSAVSLGCPRRVNVGGRTSVESWGRILVSDTRGFQWSTARPKNLVAILRMKSMSDSTPASS
ncbi:hypothetical protein Trydic_g5802, partial [Trypoxylus dichotomus]